MSNACAGFAGECTERFFTPLEEAVEIARERRRNEALAKRATEYLAGDVPAYYRRPSPVLFLARHIATPNYEALKFIEMGKPFGWPLIITQDSRAKFVTNNNLKLSLGKMPIARGQSRGGAAIVEHVSIIDIARAQGRRLCDIYTKEGEGFIACHNRLFREICPGLVEIHDEADWIDRNHRTNLVEQYKRMLALACAHGIMFESYTAEEHKLVDGVLGPAFRAVEMELGMRPLIVEHITAAQELERNWNGYPGALYAMVNGLSQQADAKLHRGRSIAGMR